MPSNVCVLIDVFFPDLPLPQRVERVAALGFRAVETWQGGDAAVMQALGAACRESGVRLASIVMNGPADMRVAPVKSGNRPAFLEQLDRHTDLALAAGCQAGIVTTGNGVPDQSSDVHRACLIECLQAAGDAAGAKGFSLNLEPLNTRVDHPGYYLDDREAALAIVQAVARPNVRLLYDLYHLQVMGGNHLAFILPHLAWIGHFHAAGVPGRHELFESELDYPYVLGKILAAGYTGFIGLEYLPALPSEESLRKTQVLLAALGAAAPGGSDKPPISITEKPTDHRS